MSFYVFLLVTSLLCCCQARPSDPAAEEDKTAPAETGPAPSNPTGEPNPSTNVSEEQKRVDELIKQVQNALDIYITPFMVNVTKEDQKVLKDLGVEEFGASVNYLLYVIQELNDPSFNGDSIDRNSNDILVQFDSFDPFPGVPFVEQKDSPKATQ